MPNDDPPGLDGRVNPDNPDHLDALLAWLREREARTVAPGDIADAVARRIAAARPTPEQARAVLGLVHSIAEQPTLARRLKAAQSRSEFLETLKELGEKRGVQFTTDAAAAVLRSLHAANDDGELSDDQLNAVAGGQGAMLLELGTMFVRLP